MVENDDGIRRGACDGDQLWQLVMIIPGVIGEAARAKMRDAAPEIRVAIKAFRPPRRNEEVRTGRIVGSGMPDAPEQAFGGLDMGVQHLVQRHP